MLMPQQRNFMEVTKKKRIRRKPGQILRIPLGNGVFAYGQTRTISGCIFFDYKDDGIATDPQFVIKQPVIFQIGIDDYAIRDQLWEVIAVLPVNPEFDQSKRAFTYNSDTNEYYIWEKGKDQIPATPEDIKGLEAIASWGHRSAEQRLIDYFEGRPNYDFEADRNEHNPNFPKTCKEFYAQYGYVVKEDDEVPE